MTDDKILFRGQWVVRSWPEQIENAQNVTAYSVRGDPVDRVRYGDEEEDWGAEQGRPCHDCAVIAGELHVPGCDVERCRICGGQLIGCECPYDDVADEDLPN